MTRYAWDEISNEIAEMDADSEFVEDNGWEEITTFNTPDGGQVKVFASDRNHQALETEAPDIATAALRFSYNSTYKDMSDA